MFLDFQMIVLMFIRDWYQTTAMNSAEPTRHFLNDRAKVCQDVIDRLRTDGGDEE